MQVRYRSYARIVPYAYYNARRGFTATSANGKKQKTIGALQPRVVLRSDCLRLLLLQSTRSHYIVIIIKIIRVLTAAAAAATAVCINGTQAPSLLR